MLKFFTLKELALWASFGLGFFTPFIFAYDIYEEKFVPNMVTWLLVLFLDVAGLWIAYKEGNKRPLLQLGWVAAAVCIMLAIFIKQSIWHVGVVEIASTLLCVLAIILWRTTARHHAVLLGLALQTTAVYVSFIPQAIDYWNKPEPDTWYLWFWSMVGCILAIYASPKRDLIHTFIPWGAFALNTLILILVMR